MIDDRPPVDTFASLISLALLSVSFAHVLISNCAEASSWVVIICHFFSFLASVHIFRRCIFLRCNWTCCCSTCIASTSDAHIFTDFGFFFFDTKAGQPPSIILIPAVDENFWRFYFFSIQPRIFACCCWRPSLVHYHFFFLISASRGSYLSILTVSFATNFFSTTKPPFFFSLLGLVALYFTI